MRRTAAAIVVGLALAGSASAASLRGTIYASTNNGPYVYTFEVDGALKYNVNGIANAGAAFDSVKARIGNEGGTIVRVKFVVAKGTAKIVADLRPSQVNGPFAYTYEVDGAWETVVNSVASLSAAADAIKTLVGAEPGTFIKGTIGVVTQ